MPRSDELQGVAGVGFGRLDALYEEGVFDTATLGGHALGCVNNHIGLAVEQDEVSLFSLGDGQGVVPTLTEFADRPSSLIESGV